MGQLDIELYLESAQEHVLNVRVGSIKAYYSYSAVIVLSLAEEISF